MKLLLDQNVPKQLCTFLRRLKPGWETVHVGEVGLWGASDSAILAWAQPDRWIVITFDEDFADARMFPVGSHAGVIRLRVWPTTIEKAESALGRLFREVAENEIAGSLIIIDEQRIRVRRAARHG